MKYYKTILGLCSGILLSSLANAQTYNFTLNGSGTVNTSIIQGIIDIDTDTLTVTSWTDLPGDAINGFNFWTAAVGTVFNAQVVSGPSTGAQTAAYDITSLDANNFNFDNGAFVFRLPGNDNVTWNEGSYPFTSGAFIASNGSTTASINIAPVNNNQNGAWGGTMTVTAIPEPSSSLLAMLGAFSFILRKRRSAL